MKACFNNRIILYYLMPNPSHICQPLDLSTFSVVKSRYRQAIADLALFDDAANVKKERFLALYNMARNGRLTKANIEAGWRATSIHPYCSREALESSQVTRPTIPAISTTAISMTPPSQRNLCIIKTPQKHRDLHHQISAVASIEQISRTVRTLFHETEKTLEIVEFNRVV
jgi:hypothetical protein